MNIYIGENAVLKGNIRLSENCSVWHNAVIRADSGSVTIGESTNIQDLVMIHTGFPDISVIIGDHVTIGHSAIIHGCTIADHTLIGMGAIIMNHAKIGRNCIVAASSLVTERKEFPDGVLIMGSPAKVIRPLTAQEIESIQKNADTYVLEAQKSLKKLSSSN